MAKLDEAVVIPVDQPQNVQVRVPVRPVPPPYQFPDQQDWEYQRLAGDTEPLFSVYLCRTEEHDRKTVKRWKDDAGVILYFVGASVLFSIPLYTSCYRRTVYSLP
jgi:hypothetical protein